MEVGRAVPSRAVPGSGPCRKLRILGPRHAAGSCLDGMGRAGPRATVGQIDYFIIFLFFKLKIFFLLKKIF